ncbi:hypothetical protein CLN94_07935 [Pseudothioclava arenosa]|uniref:Uncharacterized protein n=2 Tax=Pseudothioclava arenosa TaxID=1795308 RepID=A0A2A4CR01_9RHOB|nr:DUF6478 family protein [Pseudothioclava arenosa]PCD76524.1 hypothetical protein CLN94_07935 [Pseudothioclava arenosa]
MPKPPSLLKRFRKDRARIYWQQAAERAEHADLEELRGLRGKAWALRRDLERVIHTAEGRLQSPALGTNAIRAPLGSDWTWRPGLWRGPVFPPGLAAAESRSQMGEVTLFHDCGESEITLRQIRNSGAVHLAPFGLRTDVFRFDGSFLSLVLDLPDAAVTGLRLNHLIRLDMVAELEKPIEIFCRLNIKHGPNTEQIVRELPHPQGACHVEFDLAYSRLNEKRIEKAWVDLIFEGPRMNQITLRDLYFARHPRAEL